MPRPRNLDAIELGAKKLRSTRAWATVAADDVVLARLDAPARVLAALL